MEKLDQSYWENRYLASMTGWDTGTITTPLKVYFDQLDQKDLRILIPGAGNGYEAIYLHKLGFTDVHVLDIARHPLSNITNRAPDFPVDKLHHEDFFIHNGTYDLLVEQTFFCAINPDLRGAYVQKAHALLSPVGKLAGLLWDDPMFSDRPPFGGSKKEYELLFSPFFQINKLEKAYNSIPPRMGREVFINLTKK